MGTGFSLNKQRITYLSNVQNLLKSWICSQDKQRTKLQRLAEHFNTISSEFTPLDHSRDVSRTRSKPLKLLAPHEVAARLKNFKKPKSMVRGISSLN